MKRVTVLLTVVLCLSMFGGEFRVSAEDVTSSNADVIVKVGEKYKLQAVLDYMTTEIKLPVDVKINWETSNSKIATVSNGTVTGVKQGGVVIRASAENKGTVYRSSAKVYVRSTVNGVSLNKSSIELNVGQTEKLNEMIEPQSALLKTVKWKSDNTKIATVSGGTVKGVKPGFCNITVTTNDGEHTAVCSVRVYSTVTGISLDEKSLTKKVGQEFYLNYTIYPESAYLKKVKWKSSESKVASVSNGKVKALSKGTTYITVETEDGGYQAECKVTVENVVTGLTLSKSSLEMVKGNKEVVTAYVTPENAFEKSVTWKSDNSKVAKVSNDGVITAVDAGDTIIRAATKDGGIERDIRVKVVSYDIKVKSIKLEDTKVKMKVGENKWFSYKTYPEDAVVPNLKVKCTLVGGGGSTTVQIKENMIFLTAIKEGDYELTISVGDDPSISDTCEVRINSTTLGIEISHDSIDIYIGEKFQLKGAATPEEAIIKGVKWKSSDSKIAKVNASTGEVTGVKDGRCVITATTIDGDHEKVCNVVVRNPVNIESLKIKDSKGNIVGEKKDIPVADEPPEEQYDDDEESILITIDGEVLETDQPPVMINDRVLAPVRAIFESLGAIVYWNDEIQTVTGILDDITIQLTIDSNTAYVNGEPVELDVPATILNDRTLVPVRFISENLGVKVDWVGDNNTVVITTD